MDRLDAMRIFVRVVENGSFSSVARELGIGQPAVSKQIASLESYLGAPLLTRTSRRLTLTEAGRDFFQSATRLLAEFELAESRVGKRLNAPIGRVRVNVAPGFGHIYVTPRLPAFFERHPEVSIDLLVSDGAVDLAEEGLDIAVRNGELAESSLLARKIGTTPIVFAASPGYLAKRGEPGSVSDLEHHSSVVFLIDNAPQPWVFAGKQAPISYVPEGRYRSNDAEEVRAAVVAGVGVVQAPLWLFASELANGSVVRILKRYEPAEVPISVIRAAGRVPARVSMFVDFLAESLVKTNETASVT
ncbi:MAG TPA: LysR family transcriptional regulator [Polyangia bacterium]|nr:LysR family transcriptional regulator [Polyangia bacterium]